MPKNDPLDDCKAYTTLYANVAPECIKQDPSVVANYNGYLWHVGMGRFTPHLHGKWSGCNDRYPSSPMGAVSELNVMIDLSLRGFEVAGVSDKDMQKKGPDISLTMDGMTVLISVKTASGLSKSADVMWISDAILEDVENDVTSDMFAFVHNFNYVYVKILSTDLKSHIANKANIIHSPSGKVGIRLAGLSAKVVLFKHTPS